MKNIVIRKNKMFSIDMTQLSSEAVKVVEELYVALYLEFRGASTNTKYKDLNASDRISAVNTFANNWLKERGLE